MLITVSRLGRPISVSHNLRFANSATRLLNEFAIDLQMKMSHQLHDAATKQVVYDTSPPSAPLALPALGLDELPWRHGLAADNKFMFSTVGVMFTEARDQEDWPAST